jgi:hypothetical protein
MQYNIAQHFRKSVERPLLRVIGTVQQNPHMRAFWASTISFFLAFLGWVALAPRSMDVEQSMGVCEDQLFPPQEFPKGTAYLKFKNLGTLMTFCQYGKKDLDTPTDDKDVPAVISCTGTGSAEAVCLKQLAADDDPDRGDLGDPCSSG